MSAPRAQPQRPRIRVIRPGRVAYAEAFELQQRLAAGRLEGAEPDTLILLEHPPVITLGRGAHAENVLLSDEALAGRGIERVASDRGGDVTYHGPGQVVAYPILELPQDRRDVRRYVQDLEEVMIRTCADYGLVAGRKERMNGVWLGGEVSPGPWRKIGAVGVHIARWITTHGLALNVDPSMDHFRLIVPCGIADHGVTSLGLELPGNVPTLEEVMDRLEAHFAEVFQAELLR